MDHPTTPARYLLTFILLALAASNPAQAAEVRTAAGAKALVFTLNGLSDLHLSGYEGGIGMRWYTRSGLALRPGLTWDWQSVVIHPDPVPSGQPRPHDSQRHDITVGLDLALEKHLPGSKSLSPYLGGGFAGDYHNKRFHPFVSDTDPVGTLTKTTDRGWTAGVFGMAGFEWGCTEGITIGAEYRLHFSATSDVTEREIRGQPDQLTADTASFSSSFRASSIYLSVAL